MTKTGFLLRALPILLVRPLAYGAADAPLEAKTAEGEMLARFAREEAGATAELEKSPRDVSWYSRRGDARLFLGRFVDAVADFEKMIELDPAQDAPHWRLGIAYYFAGKFAAAARQFEKYQTYEKGDRENGIWKFLADVKTDGLEKARARMLVYERFDREPFPALYDMFAGRKSSADVLAHAERAELRDDPTIQFFARYYAGLNEEILGQRAAAREHVRGAVATYSPAQPPRGGASYMWQVARLHLRQLSIE